jgi:hypothetical protein
MTWLLRAVAIVLAGAAALWLMIIAVVLAGGHP